MRCCAFQLPAAYFAFVGRHGGLPLLPVAYLPIAWFRRPMLERGWFEGDGNDEGAAGWACGYADVSAVQYHEMFYDGQAKPHAAFLIFNVTR